MKAKAKTYRNSKLKKYNMGSQTLNPNIDPTTQYEINRGKSSTSVADTNFNNSQQALINQGLQQQQFQDKTNQSLTDFGNKQTSSISNRAAVSSAVSKIPVAGGIVAAGMSIGGGIGDKLNQKSFDQALAGQSNKGTQQKSLLLTDTGSKLAGAKSGVDVAEAFIPINGLFGKSSQDKAEEAAVEAQNKEKQVNAQLSKYGAIDTTYQNVQADKGKKNLKYKYKTGTSEIHIKPENKGKFNATKKATGKTTEELTHSSNPITKKRAVFAQNASKWDKKADGSKKLKTRVIETQGKEPVFSPKDSSGKRDLIYYNPSDPSHKEGGVKAAVTSGKEKIRGILNIPQGSAIVTAHKDMNKKALKAYQKGDDKTLEKVINQMPEDNLIKAKKYNKKYNGTFSLNKPKEEEPYNVYSPLNPNNTNGVLSKTNNNQGFGFNEYSSLNQQDQTVPTNTADKKSSLYSKVNNVGSGLAQAAPSIYNLGRGLLEKPEVTKRRYISNKGYKYKDMSAPARRAANEAQLVQSNNIRNATGGSGGAFLANQAMASAERFKNISDINLQESGKRQNIMNANVDVRNQQNQANLGLANQYDQLDLQNKAAKTGFIGAGLTGISDLSFNNQAMKNQANADRIRANTLETNNYKYDVEDEKNIYKKAKGSKKLKGSNSLRYKKK